MNYRLYSLFLFTFIFASFTYADNPGEVAPVPEVVEEAVEEAVEDEATEEVVSEDVSEDTSSDVDEDVVSLEKVIVTGSRIKRTQ